MSYISIIQRLFDLSTEGLIQSQNHDNIIIICQYYKTIWLSEWVKLSYIANSLQNYYDFDFESAP